MRLQEQMENGNWVDAESRRERYIQMAIDYAREHGENTDIEARLAAGEEVRIIPNYWYAVIRETQKAQKPEKIETVLCDCGHRVRRESVMNTSTGTSCPDCYDRMSY